MPLTPFPNLPAGHQWSTAVRSAYDILHRQSVQCDGLLSQDPDHLDPVQCHYHSHTIRAKMLPILIALERDLGSQAWVSQAAECLLQRAALFEARMEDGDIDLRTGNVTELRAVSEHRSSRRGRPSKVIDASLLREALSQGRKITLSTLACALKVHRNTLRKYLVSHGIPRQRFSTITNEDLDILLQDFKKKHPKSGLRYATGYLKNLQFRVQRRRVRASLRRVDAVGQVLRRRTTISRRRYKNKRPNAMWHIDGHHKLIRWGIVIHGIVDGYSRAVVGLRASGNNLSATVLELFLNATRSFGVPSRVRGDRGGENIGVSTWMVMYRGANRGSFQWGTSTRNTRIERLWPEVGALFARQWRAFFERLERIHNLDADNPQHIWLIHHLFLDDINKGCDEFRDIWNHHPVSRYGREQTPSDMHFLGRLEHGAYQEGNAVHPDTLAQYAAQIDMEPTAEDFNSALVDCIEADVSRQVHHDPIAVKRHEAPVNNDTALHALKAAIREVQETGLVPNGFGLCEDEWGENGYPSAEIIQVARKEVVIPLPFEVWYPRAVKWVQGLVTMSIFCLEEAQ